MNEFGISDYSIFADAVAATNDCSNKVSLAKDGIAECMTVISDGGVFMGPIQEKCVAVLNNLDADCSSIISNLGSVSNYLTSTSGNYQTGDKNANDSVTAVGNENSSRFGNFINNIFGK